MRIAQSVPSSSDEKYELITGKASIVRDHYNAVRIDLTDDIGAGRRMAIEARAYEEAIAVPLCHT